MTKPIQSGAGISSSSLPFRDHLNRGENALDAPVTPAKVLPQVDRAQVNPEILKAAEGMEAMFLDYLMKVMRQTVPKNDLDLESPATEIYRAMMDSEYAQKAAHHGGVGLADQIIAYLEARVYNQNRGHGVPNRALEAKAEASPLGEKGRE